MQFKKNWFKNGNFLLVTPWDIQAFELSSKQAGGKSCSISNCFSTRIGSSTKVWIHLQHYLWLTPKQKKYDVIIGNYFTYNCINFMTTDVACVVGPSVNPNYKIKKFKMWELFCNVCISVLNNQIWKEIMLKLNGKPSSVTTFSMYISFQNLEFISIFKNRNHLKINIPHIPN